MTEQPDLQINIFGAEVPLDKVEQHAVCTRDENCKADTEDHFDDCPVEQRLRETFGF